MRLRLLTAAAVAAMTALALPVHGAAPKPQIVDAKGDAVFPEAGIDIVSGLFATTGTTTKVGSRTVYTPKALQVTVTYAAPPSSNPLASHGVTFNLPGCGGILLQGYGGAGASTYGTADCLEGSFDFGLTAKGNTLVFSMPFGLAGKSMKAGVKLTALRAWTGGADPVIGAGPYDADPSLVADEGTTTLSYIVK